MVSAEPCESLEWDTAFFGLPVARVGADSLTPGRVAAIDDWCARNRIRCLYFLARFDDPLTVRLAETHHFQLVDVRLAFEIKLGPASTDAACRVSAPGDPPDPLRLRRAETRDIDWLQAMTRDNYQDTRFFFDQNFPRPACELLYTTWIKRSCEGYAAAVWVAEFNQQPAGYITCHMDDPGRAGRIGLVGVATGAQRRGIGRHLVQQALAWFQAAGVEKVSVVTQGRNIAAQRLYQRAGFVTETVHLWYHKWFT